KPGLPPGGAHTGGGVGLDRPRPAEPPEVAPERGGPARDGAARVAPGREVREVAAERGPPDIARAREAGPPPPHQERSQVAAVGLDRGGCRSGERPEERPDLPLVLGRDAGPVVTHRGHRSAAGSPSRGRRRADRWRRGDRRLRRPAPTIRRGTPPTR